MLKTLKQVMEEKLDSNNVQLASVTKDRGFRIYSDEEMSEIVGRLPDQLDKIFAGLFVHIRP